MLSTLLIVNIIISVLHSVKHVPQCLHMMEHENADGLSIRYIQGELLLNMLSSVVTFKMFVTIHNSFYLLPVLIEKTFAFSMIITMYYLKQKYTGDLCDDDWRSVDSEYSDDDDWCSVDSE
jgi:hypothetical protein